MVLEVVLRKWDVELGVHRTTFQGLQVFSIMEGEVVLGVEEGGMVAVGGVEVSDSLIQLCVLCS